MSGSIKDKPGLTSESTDAKAKEYTDKSIKETDSAGDKAIESTKKQEQKVHDTDKKKIDPNHGKNIAKGKGTYDMYNNRDYSTTLRLAREADAYNSRPREHIYEQNHWKAGGTQDLGTGFEKPELKTMETRAMDQVFQLDTNQKQLAQALQDAANRQDLEAFQEAWRQKYGIELDKMQAELEMVKLQRQLQQQQLFTKDMSAWSEYFKRAFGLETADYIMSQVKNDPLLASMYAQVLGGWAAPAQVEYVAQGIINQKAQGYINQGKDEFSAILQAIQDVDAIFLLDNTQKQKMLKDAQNYFKTGEARKAGKKTTKDAIEERYGE